MNKTMSNIGFIMVDFRYVTIILCNIKKKFDVYTSFQRTFNALFIFFPLSRSYDTYIPVVLHELILAKTRFTLMRLYLRYPIHIKWLYVILKSAANSLYISIWSEIIACYEVSTGCMTYYSVLVSRHQYDADVI